MRYTRYFSYDGHKTKNKNVGIIRTMDKFISLSNKYIIESLFLNFTSSCFILH